MADATFARTPADRAPRRGLSFPFFLTLVLFIAVLCDVWLGESTFVSSAAYRQQPYIFAAVAIFGLLLWLWVLAAARTRSQTFEGPIQTARGTNGAFQPILATIFIVSGLSLAYSHTIPKWLNFFASEAVGTEGFAVTGVVANYRSGCYRADASHPRFGDVKLCLDEDTADQVRQNPGRTLSITGTRSWFGIEPRRYALGDPEMLDPAEPLPAELQTQDGSDEEPPPIMLQSQDDPSDEPPPIERRTISRNKADNR